MLQLVIFVDITREKYKTNQIIGITNNNLFGVHSI